MLRAVGFCGIDDSCSPQELVNMAVDFPLVEFGVLFRPDQEGQPRYATAAWVNKLSQAVSKKKDENNTFQMKLAAHLCGDRVKNVLAGDTAFIDQLVHWGFQRVQVNATAVNGVDTSRLDEAVPDFVRVVEAFSHVEFILQQNEETKPLWQGLLTHYQETGLPSNVSMLVDESKGTGVAAKSWPLAGGVSYPIGYAGGIGPSNIKNVLESVEKAAERKPVWIDMESSLRSIRNGKDVFDLDKCYQVMQVVCKHTLAKQTNSSL